MNANVHLNYLKIQKPIGQESYNTKTITTELQLVQNGTHTSL